MTKDTLWRGFLAGLVLLLATTGVAMFFGAWQGANNEDLQPYPYTEGRDISLLPGKTQSALADCEVIRKTLNRHSTEGLAMRTDAIAEAFFTDDPRIASCAKRLGAEKDVESARRAFMRMNRLVQKHIRSLPKK